MWYIGEREREREKGREIEREKGREREREREALPHLVPFSTEGQKGNGVARMILLLPFLNNF